MTPEYYSASAEWSDLESKRTGKVSRAERLAEVSIPSVCTDDSYNTGQDDLTNGTSSLGSQCATHLVNKLMLAMFGSSRPFFRLALPEAEDKQLAEAAGITPDQLTDMLAQGERDATLELEMIGGRDVLYEIITHLVVVGDILLDLSDKKDIQAHPLRNYVVRRDRKGAPVCIIIRECILGQDLDEDLRKYAPGAGNNSEHYLFHRIKRRKGKMVMDVALDGVPLPYREYGGSWSIEDCPYIPLTWRLPLRQHYGVGRVEEYYRDFASFEIMSEAMGDGAVLAAQFRWLANPGGITRPEDMAASINGAVIPGVKGDLELVAANIGQQLSTVLTMSQEYSRRLGAGFLINSAVTRDAERVTAEEIRIQAQELEQSLGGVYSRLAKDIQQPLSRWLLKRIDLSIKGTKIVPVVMTGLDALSRNADLERLMMWLQDVTNLGAIPPEQRARLNEATIIADMAAGRGVNTKRYLASAEEVQARMQQMQNNAAAQGQAAPGVVPTEGAPQ